MDEYTAPRTPAPPESGGAGHPLPAWAALLLAVIAAGAIAWWLMPHCGASCTLMYQSVRVDTMQLQLIRLYRQTGKLEHVDEKLKAPEGPSISASYLGANGTLVLVNDEAGTVLIVEPVIAANGALRWRCRLWPRNLDEDLWCGEMRKGPSPASIEALPP